MDSTIRVQFPGLEGKHEYEFVRRFQANESPVPALYRYRGPNWRANRFLVAREFRGEQQERIERLCRAFQEAEKRPQDEVKKQESGLRQGGRVRVAHLYGLDVSQRYCLTEFIRWNHEQGDNKEPDDDRPACTLAEYVQSHKNRRLSLAESYGIISQVASALHWLADKGGHGDIQESNVLVQKSGRVVLVDPKYEIPDASAADLKQLDALFLYLLTGISTQNAQKAGLEWTRREKQIAEDDRKAIAVARNALNVDAVAAAPVQAALENFLKELVEAPSVTPLPFPASFGSLLSQGIFGLVLGAVLLALGLMMLFASSAPAQVAQKLPQKQVTAPPPLTPVPTSIVEVILLVTPELTTPPPSPTTPEPSNTPSTPDIPIPASITPTLDTSTPVAAEPAATPKPVASLPPVIVKVSPSSTPAFPLDKLPYNCAPNEDALAQLNFGFVEPLSHQDLYGGKVKVKIDGSLNYTVRAMAMDQLPATRNIDDWHALEECGGPTGSVRCQRPIPSRTEHEKRWDLQGNLYVDWQGVDRTHYALLLQIERLENQITLRQYCAYVYDVTYRSQP